MYAHPISPHSLRLPHFFTRWLAALFAAFLLALAAMPAHAAAPAAGTSISNQASASYTDASGVPRTATSNTVQTLVTQVASMTLTVNGAQNATAGSVVYYPHTLTNTGNGLSAFTLATSNSGPGFTMTGVQIFADNGSGAPTGPAITAPVSVAAGSVFNFVVVGTVPNTAAVATTNAIAVTAAMVTIAGVTAPGVKTNTDTTTVTNNAVVTLTKAIDVSSGLPNTGPYTYTLTYTNTGNSTATAVAITDAIPTGMTYVANSARWSVMGVNTVLNDGASAGTGSNTLTPSYSPSTFSAALSQVMPGQSGTISFKVTVNAGVAPGVINNIAAISYSNGATPTPATVTGTSGTVSFTVLQTAAVTFTGPAATTSANPGSTVSFTNVVTNTGTGTDTFNITLDPTATPFPVGTTFQLFKSDGATPLVDTNGDGIIDTGPLAAGATYNVILKAALPPGALSGGPFTINKTATSVVDPTKKATATDTLNSITGASVDLTNKSPVSPGLPGTGAGPEGSAQVTNATNPGTTTVFTLVTQNTGPSSDSYDLAASTAGNFSGLTLPAGWTVTFKAADGVGSCSTPGATIINTGSVASNASTTVCAVVTVPAGSAAGTTDLYFRSLSPVSGAKDILHDAVTVNVVRSITITPNGTGQTYPGGSYVYSHTLTNNGNVTEGTGTLSTITPSLGNNQPGWTSTLYYDTNNNGVLDAADSLISGTLNAVLSSGLTTGQSITLFNKVIAPSGAAAGAVNTTTITVTTVNGASYSTTVPAATVATDGTTVIAGNLTLVKEQALDASCVGTGTITYATGNLNAKPGDCVMYKITVTNVGAADATSVVVSDSMPSYTTLSVAVSATPGVIATGAPTVGGVGPFSANIGTGATNAIGGTLAASTSAVVTFGVKINN